MVIAEERVKELIDKYLGISVLRIIIGILMLIFGILVILYPDLIGLLIGIYLLINGILILIDEAIKARKVKSQPILYTTTHFKYTFLSLFFPITIFILLIGF